MWRKLRVPSHSICTRAGPDHESGGAGSGCLHFLFRLRPAGSGSGFLVGLLSIEYKIGFVGGIVGGLAVGYFCKLIKEKLPLSKDLASLLPMLIIPTLGGLFAVLFMDYILGPVLGGLQSYLSTLFAQMQSGSRVVFGMVLGALMGVDLGGPVTKIGTTVVNGLVADGILGRKGPRCASV